jgi:hypothetical protein
MEKKRFKELFPHLADELESGRSTVDLKGETTGTRSGLHMSRKWAGYDPDIIDFIRRCDSNEQAAEIIDYMKQEAKITSEMADKLRNQLEEEGVRSFGKQKEPGYYNKNAR